MRFAKLLSCALVVSSSSQVVDAKRCGDALVAKASALNLVVVAREDMARAICRDLEPFDRAAFASCVDQSQTAAELDHCVRVSGHLAMRR